MKLSYVAVCGFRGYQKPVRLEFADNFTIIDGRNGVGKSTIFDAVEFALTGTISKYLDAKADRESVQDYLWWSGEGQPPKDRYVEVGFRDGEGIFSVRRTPLDSEHLDISKVASKLIDRDCAPATAMAQLCASSIIRDEHIARLSLDLKEGDRFTLLRDAIGAVDADTWIKRASHLASGAAAKVRSAAAEVEQANAELALSVRQIDQARSALPAASIISQAASRLQTSLRTTAPADQIAEIARRRIAEIARDLDIVQSLSVHMSEIDHTRAKLDSLEAAIDTAAVAVIEAERELEMRATAIGDAPVSTELSKQARQLDSLVSLGRLIGTHDGNCPLCESEITHEQFESGLHAALKLARQLDAQAVDHAEKERARDGAQSRLFEAEASLKKATDEHEAAKVLIAEFSQRLEKVGLPNATAESTMLRIEALKSELATIVADLRLLDTISLNQALVRASESQHSAKDRVARAEARLGRARLADTRARAIHDAARRAAAETLDQRLERVLPLMSELYKRLRPHPIWHDIDYSVRGDVKRFLKLQVGSEVNPQFVFSSGQRRATGLAFLLSINLSIAWSRWQSILLDDPVQHVDDFRTVHLAEVLAHLCQGGRQIVCAVEDSALADLMCRRLPTSDRVVGKRITLSNDAEGALAITRDEPIATLNRRSLVVPNQPLTA